LSALPAAALLLLTLLTLGLGIVLARLWQRHLALQRRHSAALEDLWRALDQFGSSNAEPAPRALRGGTHVDRQAAGHRDATHRHGAYLPDRTAAESMRGAARAGDTSDQPANASREANETGDDTIAGIGRLTDLMRKIDEKRIAGARTLLLAASVQRHMSEGVCIMGADFRVVATNPSFTRITGYAEAEVLGREIAILESPQHDAEFYAAIRMEVATRGHWSGELWARRKDGEEYLCSAVLFSTAPPGHGTHTIVSVFSDITHQRRAEQELRYLVNFDALTNLPNRALLSERLSRAIVRARREHGRLAVLFIDFDHFKDVNDSLGHSAGDRILRTAAERLQLTVGEGFTVARLGGDEFTVVQENIGSAEDAERTAREIITAFEAPLPLDDSVEVSLSPSIGISLYPEHGQVPTELIKRADTAMYQAKADGRRTHALYDESMEVVLRERATVSGALRKVLEREELRLVFQPRLSLSLRRIVGVEALLRWNSDALGDIPPTTFIPLAEETGLILEFGEWVLREACLTLRRWQDAGISGLSMSVNVSALQLLRGDFPQVVDRVLAETGVSPDLLELELTESVIMANAEHTADKLHSFRRSGVSVAIDDFGTGYSSLAYLRRLPITTLKIDKEFIGDLSNDADDASITTTVIAMAHSLGLNVVAEGVETREQLAFLDAQGCDEVQGYWLSPPLEQDACLAFLREWAPLDTLPQPVQPDPLLDRPHASA
jgi:diguanylate cyclase (GGDEF)-like protein/PAS domain S-box-containing protein